MGPEAIPNEIRQFLADHIDSVVQLEVLLLLHANPARQWTPAEVGLELRVDSAWVARQLADLCHRQILGCTEGAEPRYYCAPTNPAVARAVAALAILYGTHRVSIITMIFSKPVDKLRSFADAFRIRKD